MANIKVSEMTAATSVSPDNLLMIVSGGTNKKITYANLFNTVTTNIQTLRTDIGQTATGAVGTGEMYIKDGMVYAKDSSGTYVPLFTS